MKTLVLGSGGLVGSAIKRIQREEFLNDPVFIDRKCNHFVFATRRDADLLIKEEVFRLFECEKPDVVINCGARVGGVGANEAGHADFFYENMTMILNVTRACLDYDVKQLIAFSSVCVFPDDLALLEEDRMHDGPVFASNDSYGYAKRMQDVYINAVNKQHGKRNWTSIIPANIFGPQDLFSIEEGHVIPALIMKLYLAIENDTDFCVWGDGHSLREFIYVDDLARIILSLLGKQIPQRVIVSGRQEHSIRDIVNMLAKISGFDGNVVYDPSKPNGQRSRPSSKRVVDELCPGFEYSEIYTGLQKTWDWFVDNYPNVRTQYT